MHKYLLFFSLPLVYFLGMGQPDYRIYLQSDTLEEAALLAPFQVKESDLIPHTFQGNAYLILQFDHIPSLEEKTGMKARGITLLEYLPNYAFLARVKKGSDLTTLGLRHVGLLQPQHKLSRSLASGNIPAHALSGTQQLDLVVLPYRDIPLVVLKEYLQKEGFSLHPATSEGYGVALRIGRKELSALAGLAPVMFVEPVEAPSIPDDLRGRTVHRANSLSQGPRTGYDGTGITMAIADDGGINHIDFKGRLNDFTPTQGGTHGDGTSGIAVGAGNLDPTMMGMGTGAFLNLYNINGYPHINNAIPNFNNLETVITSTSYSQGCGGIYDGSSRTLDLGVDSLRQLLHVFSAGNSASSSCSSVYGSVVDAGGYYYGNITGGRKAAKSTITTANLFYEDRRELSSSRGPCEDGRIKPDIAAHGQGQMTTAPENGYMGFGGTSAAAPGVGGVSTMLYQAYRETHNGAYPQSSLIKGILLNTADDLGRSGPDYDFGWGRINARRALEVLLNQQYINGTVAQGGNASHTIPVPNGIKQLKVMVYWKDPAGSPTAAQALVNDLNMTLGLPGGGLLYPWTLSAYPSLDSVQRLAQRGIDLRNNMEQVTFDNPTAGNYTVTISGTTVPMGPQDYHVVYSFVENGITVTYPAGGESVVPGETETLRWDAFGNTGTFALAYSTNNGNSWIGITGNINGSQRFYDWTVPNTVTGQALVRVTRGNETGISAARFNIIGLPGNVRFQGRGIFSTDVTWNAVGGANRYDVFLLGPKYMDSVGTTASLSFSLNNLLIGKDYWVAIRARNTNGTTGRRGNAVFYNHQLSSSCGGCVAQICEFPYEESFEQGLGSWCQEISDDIDWTRFSGGTSSANTGPSTAANGTYYLYIESSLPNYPGKVATIGSPCFNLASFSTATLSFSYNMYGANMGRLDLLVSTDQGNTWSGPIWTKQGNQGSAWVTETLSLNAYTGGSLAFRFKGTTGTGFTSDIALDRIIVNGSGSLTPPSLNVISNDITCFGAHNGSASAQLSGGATPYSYHWSTGTLTPTINGLGVGNYAVVVLDTQLCAVYDTFSIEEPTPVVVVPTTKVVTCFAGVNGSASLSVSGGMAPYSYSWSTGDTGATLTGVPAGTYGFTVTDALGCIQQDSVVVTQPSPLALNLTHTDVTCYGDQDGSASIAPSGGNGTYSIIWSTNSTATSISGLSAGIYQVLVSDQKGCFTSSSVAITGPADLVLSTSFSDPTCFDSDDGWVIANAAGGNGGYSYLWSNGDPDSMLTQLKPGSYIVSVTDIKGCTASDSLTLTAPPALLLAFLATDASTPSANDGTIDLSISGGTLPYASILWSTGDSTEDLSGLAPGVYQVTVTDANGCILRDSVFIGSVTALTGQRPLKDLKLYPNPTRETLYLSFYASQTLRTEIKILDLHGRVLERRELESSPGRQQIIWDVSRLAAGPYFLSIQNALGRSMMRWEVVR